MGGDGGQGSVRELTWRSLPGPCAQPGPPEGPCSRDLSLGEELTWALNTSSLVPQKTKAGRFVPGTHGALAALSRLLQTAQRMVGDLDLDSPTEEDKTRRDPFPVCSLTTRTEILHLENKGEQPMEQSSGASCS